MKAAGVFLLFAGFAIVLSAFLLLPLKAPRGVFIVAGMILQLVGLVLTFRSHMTLDEGQ
jgi:hypothetical protein